MLVDGSAFTFLGVPPGQGTRFGIDRDENGVLDGDEPKPSLSIARTGSSGARLQWPNPSLGWLLQTAPGPAGPWQAMTRALVRTGGWQWIDESTTEQPAAFYRLRRTW